MRCLLYGHTPIVRDGVGPYAGIKFTLCAECGITLDSTREYQVIDHIPEDKYREMWAASLGR